MSALKIQDTVTENFSPEYKELSGPTFTNKNQKSQVQRATVTRTLVADLNNKFEDAGQRRIQR